MSNILPSDPHSSSVDSPAPLDSTRNGMAHPSVPAPAPVHPDTGPDPYRAVVLLLLAASILGMVADFVAAQMLGNPVLFNVAITFGIAAGILIGIAVTRTKRAPQPDADDEERPAAEPAVEAETTQRQPTASCVQNLSLPDSRDQVHCVGLPLLRRRALRERSRM